VITVHKYEIPIDQPHQARLPGGSKVVHTASDYPGTVTAWIMHDLDNPPELFHFRVVETGHPIEPDELHVGATGVGNRVVHLVQGVRWST
jgi:hypothetical protein